MINRTLIRLKIVQLMYAFYQNRDKNIETAEKELLYSLSKAYDLYNYLLMLMIAITRYGISEVEHKEEINKAAHINKKVSHRFIDNKFIMQLEQNAYLNEYKTNHKKSWDNEIAYIKKIYETIISSDIYAEYMAGDIDNYDTDREFWRKVYKNIIMKDEQLSEVIEDQSLYWNDDREIVDTFVLKTIKRFNPINGENQELVPEYKDIEDRDFAVRLFRRTIMNDEYYHELISKCIKNWEFNRLAYMDIIIMQIAIAEMLSFPNIPVSVTINEYVEIAKWYSTPKSAKYVNGIIDSIAKMLKREGKLLKN